MASRLSHNFYVYYSNSSDSHFFISIYPSLCTYGISWSLMSRDNRPDSVNVCVFEACQNVYHILEAAHNMSPSTAHIPNAYTQSYPRFAHPRPSGVPWEHHAK